MILKYINTSSSLALKFSTSLLPLFNQFKNFYPEGKNESQNVVNSNYYDIDQFQILKFLEKNKFYPVLHKCMLIR